MRRIRTLPLVAIAMVLGCSPFGSDAAEGDAAAGSGNRLVFVGSRPLTPGPDFLKEATDLCSEDGRGARPSGRFVPWLSTTGNAANLLTDGSPWATAGGNTVFRDRGDVIRSTLGHSIDAHANRGPVAPGTKVWTGTEPDGTKTSAAAELSCEGFGSAATMFVGTVGAPADFTDGRWTHVGVRNCNAAATIVCFEI